MISPIWALGSSIRSRTKPIDYVRPTLLAEQQAMKAAANPVLMGIARGAARDAIRQNLAIPLQVAGYGEVTVRVRFDGEVVPVG